MTISPMGLAALTLSQEYALAVFPLHEMRNGRCSCGWPAGHPKCKPAKHPRTANGVKDASTHPEQIGEWWDRWPSANIGAVPGSIGCVAVDQDGKKSDPLLRGLGVFDVDTCQTITSRGAHHWLRLPKGVHVGNLSQTDIDIRAHSGYVIVPPSIHPTGHVYTWRGSLEDVADAPAPLVDWLARGGRDPEAIEREHQRRMTAPTCSGDVRKRVAAYAEKISGLSDGRKTSAYRFAAFLAHDCNLSDDDAMTFLAIWNKHNCPPLPMSVLEQIAANARKYGGRAAA